MNADSRRERLWELLADQASDKAAASERHELRTLQAEFPDVDPHEMEAAAAVAAAAFACDQPSAIPEDLRDKLAADAQAFFSGDEQAAPQLVSLHGAASHKPHWSWNLGLFAVAASILFLAFKLQPTDRPANPDAARRALLAEAGDLLRLDWTATEDPAADGASGEVAWSAARQEGFMTFRGLAANNPNEAQYQLWIFDAQRSDAHPVDGGVFDVPEGVAEVFVPIDAKLPVAEAVMFAVTIERPGGVVVSDRSRLPLLAKVEG